MLDCDLLRWDPWCRTLLDEVNKRIVEQASRGDGVAIDRLIERHLPALLGYVRLNADKFIRNKESCEDIAQSVCREVLEDLDDFEYRGEGAFRNWLLRRARLKLVDRHRYWGAARRDPGREIDTSRLGSGKKIEEIYAPICSPSEGAIANETIERLEAAFQKLPDNYREVIILSRIVGLEHEDLAREIGKTPTASRALLYRALVRLGTIMHQAYRGESSG